jgi:hypothetical protein
MFLTEKEQKEREEYTKFLGEAMLLDSADAIAVPDVYDSLGKKVRDWDGNSAFPHTADDAVIDDIVDKILKKEPEDNGTDDAMRDETKEGPITEDCTDCEENLREIFEELGLSPLDLLEGDDDADEETGEEEKKDSEEGEHKSSSDSDAASTSVEESSILEQLIREMSLFENENEDEFVDDEKKDTDADDEKDADDEELDD